MNMINTAAELQNDFQKINKTADNFFTYGENRASKMVKPSKSTYFIGNEKTANLKPQFPDLGPTNFKITPVQALVANPANPQMAMPVPEMPGVPYLYLTNASNYQLIGKPVGGEYCIYDNEFCYELAKASLSNALPGNFLQNVEIEEDMDRSGAFSAIHIDIEDWSIPVVNGTYATELSFGVTIKHNVNEAILFSVYARDGETDNKINLGTVSTSNFYHAENSNPEKIKRHIDFWVRKGFPHRVEQLKKALKTSVTDTDIKLVLSTGGGRLLTPTQQDKIFDQIINVEAKEMGKTSYAIMSGLATWASDTEIFPVTSDNIGEAMAKRQGIVARIMMCRAMLGREFEIDA